MYSATPIIEDDENFLTGNSVQSVRKNNRSSVVVESSPTLETVESQRVISKQRLPSLHLMSNLKK